jgi:CRP/FNR family transcriptional regulator, anaerobic regulatory protein
MRGGISEARFPFLAQLSEGGRRELSAFPPTRVPPRRGLLERGDDVDGAYLLVGGSLRVYYITSEGREATLYHVEPGGTCVLALTSAFNQQPYPAWVEAEAEGALLVRIPSGPFRRLFDGEPAFRAFIFSVLSARIFELMSALEEAGSAQIEQRVARYLARRVGADSTVRATQIGIASELGTAREVVFRALRALSNRGLVETGRVRIKVLDRAGLDSAGGRSDRRRADALSARRVT